MRLVQPPFNFVEPVLVENRASPFYGMTHSKAVLIDRTLSGYQVVVQSQNDINTGIDREVAIFTRMALPGDWATVMECAYDLILESSPGVQRVVSPQLVRSFEVVSKDRLLLCELCDGYREASELVYEPEEFFLVPDWGGENPMHGAIGHIRPGRLYCRNLRCQEGMI